MTDRELLERLARTNLYPSDRPLPDVWLNDAALQDIDWREDMLTDKQTVVQAKTYPRWLPLAAAAVAVLVVAVGGLALFANRADETIGGPGTWPEFTNPPVPADVVGAAEAGDPAAIVRVWYDAFARGDVETVVRYGHPEAELFGFTPNQLLNLSRFNGALTDGLGAVRPNNCVLQEAITQVTCDLELVDPTLVDAIGQRPSLILKASVFDGLVSVAIEEPASELGAPEPPWPAVAWAVDQLEAGGRDQACVASSDVFSFAGVVFDEPCGAFLREMLVAAGSDRVTALLAEFAQR